MGMPELTLYVMDTCPYCRRVLNYLQQRRHPQMTQKDIAKNSTYRKELLDIGGKTQVPCLVIDGKALYESTDIIQWFKDHG
jgi:glutaredoxin